MRTDNLATRKAVEEAIIVLIQHGEGKKILRSGMRETPARVAKAFREFTSGYDVEPEDILKTFKDGAENMGAGNQVIVVRDIPFYSLCEHHLAPFWGVAHIGYVPKDRIVGLSKFKRLTDVFARRFQVQERLTNQIADTIATILEPKGVAVSVVARHMCMESRGVQTQGSSTVTNALRGCLLTEDSCRAEFFSSINTRDIRV